MKKVLLFGSLLALASCADTEIQETPVLKEKAVVVTTLYSPSRHDTRVTQTAFDHGGVMGTDYNGNSGVKISKNMQITTTTIPEKYGVAFQCEHGTFTVEGEDNKYRVLHNKLSSSVGDTVTVLYKEQYKLTYEKINGVRTLVKRELYDLDFIDAQK